MARRRLTLVSPIALCKKAQFLHLPVIFAFLLAASPVEAQPQRCMPHAEMLAWLAQQYGESPIARAVSDSDNNLTITVHPESQVFTVLHTGPQGVACIVDTGQSFRVIQEDERTNADQPA